MEKWWMVSAWNQQAVYCFGTETQAERYADVRNKGKNVNLLQIYELTDEEVEDLRLEQNDEAFNLDDWEREYEYELSQDQTSGFVIDAAQTGKESIFTPELDEWRDGRETSLSVAKAIFEVAASRDHAHQIWLGEADVDYGAIEQRARELRNPNLEGDTLFWGEHSFKA